jgi:predicted porin
MSYSSAQYKSGALRLVTQSAALNTVGAIATYNPTPAFGYSCTAEMARNGISSPAMCNRFSMDQLSSLSKRVAFRAIQVYQRANRQRQRARGTGTSIVYVVASVSDAQNGAPSNGRGQFVDVVGIRHSF